MQLIMLVGLFLSVLKSLRTTLLVYYFTLVFMFQGDDGALQKAVALVLQNREDFVAILFYASWCPFSKIFRTDFQKLSSFFPTIAHFSFEESHIKPRCVFLNEINTAVRFNCFFGMQLNFFIWIAESCQGMEFVHSQRFSFWILQCVCAIMDLGPWIPLLCSIKMLQVLLLKVQNFVKHW